ncbi:MAG: hypothetical protein OXK19_04070 [Candidatus Dadabacteria bacterium]|nr:hypothetical protein [Candidatus Dadabacteria bacterium]
MAENLGSIRICEFRMPKMTLDIEKGKTGTLSEDFLKEQGTYEETTERAVKRVLVFQVVQLMKKYLELN